MATLSFATLRSMTRQVSGQAHGSRRRAIAPGGRYRINNARKSFTFVNVGPLTTRSPSGLKKL
jgi:hypothetical protein